MNISVKTGEPCDSKDPYAVDVPKHFYEKVKNEPDINKRIRRMVKMGRGAPKTMEIFKRTKWRN